MLAGNLFPVFSWFCAYRPDEIWVLCAQHIVIMMTWLWLINYVKKIGCTPFWCLEKYKKLFVFPAWSDYCHHHNNLFFYIIILFHLILDAMNPSKLSDALQLRNLPRNNPWHIQGTCATNGDGILEAITALGKMVKQFRKEQPRY